MLVLTSNGLTTPDLIQKATPFLKGKRCALVTTASVGFKEKDWHVPRLAEELFSCGAASVELFDFDLQSPEAFSAYDAAMLIGGNPFYLLASIRKHGFADVLNIFGKDKTLIGVSAGSMNCTSPVYAQPELPGESIDPEYIRFIPGLGISDVQILPHYQMVKDNMLDGRRLYEDITYGDSHGRSFYAIPDGSYVLRRGDTYTLCGEGYLIRDGRCTQICRREETIDITP